MRPQLKIDLQKFYPIDTEEDFRVSNDAVGANTQVQSTFETRVPHQVVSADAFGCKNSDEECGRQGRDWKSSLSLTDWLTDWLCSADN